MSIAIPHGMVRFYPDPTPESDRSDIATPADYDGGDVLLRNGEMRPGNEGSWRETGRDIQVMAYTPVSAFSGEERARYVIRDDVPPTVHSRRNPLTQRWETPVARAALASAQASS